MARQRQDRLARRHAAAAHADLELDIRVELGAARGERSDLVGVVDAYAQARAARERGKPLDLLRADHLVAHQHIGDAALHHRLRFAHLLAADADGTHGDLALGDLGTLVRLGVGAHAHRPAFQRIGERTQVALERVEVDEERGRVDLVHSLPYGGRRAHHAAAVRRVRWWKANHRSAATTTAMSGSARRLTRVQPALVTVRPELKEETAIMMKIDWSIAPCALARSSGR